MAVPVSTFRLEIGRIRSIQSGERAGYLDCQAVHCTGHSALWLCRWLLIPVDRNRYGDGSRQECPFCRKNLYGTVYVDLTDVPETTTGDEVIVFGDGSWRKHCGRTVQKMGVTRSEALCYIIQRVLRVYLKTVLPLPAGILLRYRRGA